MKKVFFDTWGWIALAHNDDSCHKEASVFYKSFILQKGLPVTTDYVLAETITLLRRRTHSSGVNVFVDAVLDSTCEGKILLININEKRFEQTCELSKKYKDKAPVSFFDISSFVVMKELDISEVLTADRHFADAGFKKLF